MRIAMLVSRVRVEEKLLLASFAQRGVDVELVDVRGLILDTARPAPARNGVTASAGTATTVTA